MILWTTQVIKIAYAYCCLCQLKIDLSEYQSQSNSINSQIHAIIWQTKIWKNHISSTDQMSKTTSKSATSAAGIANNKKITKIVNWPWS